jgi:hypothetical protein
MRKPLTLLSAILWVLFVAGCTGLMATPAPTSRDPQVVATAVEQTLQAANPSPLPDQPAPSGPTAPVTPTQPAGVQVTSQSPTPLTFNPSATASPRPSDTPTRAPTGTPSRRATYTPSITPTPPIPGAGVQWVEPGPMSKVVSPLHMIANLRSTPSGAYRIELWVEPLREGEEPRLLYREVQRIISNPVDWVYLDQDIEFQLERVAEYGQLRVSVLDEYDRLVWVNSVELVLLSMGPSNITPSNIRSEPIVIRQPSKSQLIQGGTLTVSGLVRPSEDFLLVELVKADGSVVGYRQAFVTPAADGSYVPFSADVPYTVTSGTWVSLQVSESGMRIAGVEHLSSVSVYLSP